MKSSRLLEIINQIEKPENLAEKLHEAGFAMTDITEEGDSVLHVFTQSKKADTPQTVDYLRAFIAAGVDVNAVNKQGAGFIAHYIEHRGTYIKNIYEYLITLENFDVNQTTLTGKTLFESVIDSIGYFNKDLLDRLINHPLFNPNQKTAKHNSLLIYLITEKSHHLDKFLEKFSNDTKLNPDIENVYHETALEIYLLNSTYKKKEIVTALVALATRNINRTNQDGNNYLQLIVKHCNNDEEQIAALFIDQGIDVAHKNNQGNSVFDLILSNENYRREYSKIELLLAILKKSPSSLFLTLSDNKTVLGWIIRQDNYSIESELGRLFESCKNLANGPQELETVISEFFHDVAQKSVNTRTIDHVIKALVAAGIKINIEYILAVIIIHYQSYDKHEILGNLLTIKTDINNSLALDHILKLTTLNSPEQMTAIKEIAALYLKIDRFDDTTLAIEERVHLDTSGDSYKSDAILFGHLFSLSGQIPANKRLVELTGSHMSETAPFMVHLMNAYVNHCLQTGKYQEHIEAIRQTRNMMVKAMRYHLLDNRLYNKASALLSAQNNHHATIIEDSKNTGVEILTGWSEHAISLIIKGDNFYRNNGGGCSTDATTEHYKITKPENLTEELIQKLTSDSYKKSNKELIQSKLHDLLGLQLVSTFAGKFQTVGNCGLESLRISLRTKYRLFLPEAIADEIYLDTIAYFEQFYLDEFIARHSKNADLPHLIMRLIVKRLLPDDHLALADKLLKAHFGSINQQEILTVETNLMLWKLKLKGTSTEKLNEQLQSLGIDTNLVMNERLQIFGRFLNDTVSADDLEKVKAWPEADLKFQGYHLLHLAVMNNNINLAAELIKMFPTAVNLTNWFEEEPLCLVKSVEMIDLLIKAGAKTGRTKYDNALDKAIKANSPELVTSLLAHGVKTSEYSGYYAANKHPDILRALIKHHPQALSLPTHNNSNAAHAAAKAGNKDNLRTMVYYGGVNPAARDINGVTPIQLALTHGHQEAALYLIQSPVTLFHAPNRGDSVVNMSKDDKIKRLIELKHQERIDHLAYFEKFKNQDQGVAEEEVDYLILAIRLQDKRAIKGCLLRYPDIKVVNYSKSYSTSPLHDAICNTVGKQGRAYDEALEIVKMLLLTPGININTLMITSEPLLFMATSIDDVNILELFLEDPMLDPNLQDNLGYTALHDAVERGHPNCVRRLLLDERIDASLVNNKGKTAAQLDRRRNDIRECVDLVLRHQDQKLRLK